MPAIKYANITSVIVKNLYPKVATKLASRTPQFKAAIQDFMNKNSTKINDVAPYDIIRFTDSDESALFKSLQLEKKDVTAILQNAFFWDKPYNPGCAKEPYVQVLMCAIRYFLKNKKRKEAEITSIYLAFSGKFYASIFASKAGFPTVYPINNKSVMDYVVNNMLSNKYDLKSTGSVFGAIRNKIITWLDTYGDDLCDDTINDDDIGKIIQQLRDREASFIHKIAVLFYEAYENKNYLNYESDNMSDEEFRLTDNDSLRANKYTEVAAAYIINNSINMGICNKCKDQNIKATEIYDIMTSIVSNKDNISDIYRVINVIICDFIKNYPKDKIGSPSFYANSLKAKPNIKDKYIIEEQSIILKWLDENSDNFRKRRSRLATANSYRKAVLMYFTIAIAKATERL